MTTSTNFRTGTNTWKNPLVDGTDYQAAAGHKGHFRMPNTYST